VSGELERKDAATAARGGDGPGGDGPGGDGPGSGGVGPGGVGPGGVGPGGDGPGGDGPGRGGVGQGKGTIGLGRAGARVRLARVAQGLSQQELAAAAGVTRQAVAGVEAGRWDPSLRVALSLARALGQRVDDLFESPDTLPAVPATALVGAAAPAQGALHDRAELAQVGDRTVALPLFSSSSFRAGFTPASGTLSSPPAKDDGSCYVRPTRALRPTLVVAGCDPALPLLAAPLALLDPPLALSWWPCSSYAAVNLATAGLVHVAGVHAPDGAPATGRRDDLLRRLGPAEVVSFAGWDEGLAFARHGGACDLRTAARRGLRLVNREPGSEARALLEREMADRHLSPDDVAGFATAVRGHLLVADALAAGLGDLGVTSGPAALAYGLDFVSITSERSLLVIPRAMLPTPEVRGLLRALASAALHDQLAGLPGYRGAERCGEVIGSTGG